jgi:predicted nuclease with TOPRIM domain
MATTVERLGIVETKVENLNEKLDDIKSDVKEVHDCVHRTGETINKALEEMRKESTDQHSVLASKVTELEKVKSKYTMYAMVGLAFAAGAGWINAINFPHILKFLGL